MQPIRTHTTMRGLLHATLLLAGVALAPPVVAAIHDAAPANAAPFDRAAALKTSQDALGRVAGEAEFTAIDGRRVRLSDYRGKPLVVSLVYTSCHQICPTTTQHLAKVARTARDALGPESFRVVSIGFDTLHDTPASMREFARQQNVDAGGWDFLATDAANLARLARDLGFIYFAAPSGFDHLIQATVIDADGKIYRQVYGMTFDTPLLVEPLKELVFGTPTTVSLLSSLSNRIKLFCTVYDPASDRYRFDYSIFVGIFIGFTSIGFAAFLVIREWRRNRAQRA